MQGGGIRSSFAVALLCIASVQALNFHHLCALVKEGTYLPNNAACDSFYQCQKGAASLINCPSGHWFDKESQQCVEQSLTFCIFEDPCANKLGQFVAQSNSCSGYYYCSPNGPKAGYCGNGLVFDPLNQYCVYESTYSCDSYSDETSSGEVTVERPINLCNFVRNGIYFGNPGSCAGWNYCENDAMKSGACANAFVFNVELSMCVYPSETSCSQVTNDPELMGTSSCSTLNDTKSTPQCNQYYYCDGSHYVLKMCPSGQYFDTVSKGCVARMMARNDCDRCLGSTSTFVNAYSSTNCSNYLYCVNGVEKATGSCKEGLYFDESIGGCVHTSQPSFGCCNPAAYGSSNSTDSSETTDSTDTSDSTDTTDSTETTDSSETTDSTETTDSHEKTSSSESSNSTVTSNSTETTDTESTNVTPTKNPSTS